MIHDSWVCIDRTRLTPQASFASLRLSRQTHHATTRCAFWRCINCGNIEDPVILANRWQGLPTAAQIARQVLADLFGTVPTASAVGARRHELHARLLRQPDLLDRSS